MAMKEDKRVHHPNISCCENIHKLATELIVPLNYVVALANI